MITLVFDSETTGFPSKELPLDHESQPYIVQLALLIDKGGDEFHRWSAIIQCPIEVPSGAFAIHGISRERSQDEGISNLEAMKKFENYIQGADRLIAHNASYDISMVRIAQARAGIFTLNDSALQRTPTFCTMKTLSDQARRDGRSARWPKLQTAYKSLVDPSGFAAAHSADADTLACYKILQEIEQRSWQLHQI